MITTIITIIIIITTSYFIITITKYCYYYYYYYYHYYHYYRYRYLLFSGARDFRCDIIDERERWNNEDVIDSNEDISNGR